MRELSLGALAGDLEGGTRGDPIFGLKCPQLVLEFQRRFLTRRAHGQIAAYESKARELAKHFRISLATAVWGKSC